MTAFSLLLLPNSWTKISFAWLLSRIPCVMFTDFHHIHHRSEFCPSHWSSGYAIQPSYGLCRSTGYREIASPEGRHTPKHTICMYRVRHSELHGWEVHFIRLSKNCCWIEAFIVSPLGMVCCTASCFYFQCACVQLPLRQKRRATGFKVET